MNPTANTIRIWCAAALLSTTMCGTAAAAGHVRRVQHGLASFYNGQFDGQETASGRLFDHHELVAAHRTLPLGTLVRVTNVRNGRSIKVRIIDRGPFGKNRRRGTILDLSSTAARRLGMIKDGVVPVRLQVLRLPAPADARNSYNGSR